MRSVLLALSILALAPSARAQETACALDGSAEWAVRAEGATIAISAGAEGAIVWAAAARRVQGWALDAHGALRAELPAIATIPRDGRPFADARAIGGDHLVIRAPAEGECANPACVVLQRLDGAGAARAAPLVLDAPSDARRTSIAAVHGDRAVVVIDRPTNEDELLLVTARADGSVALLERRSLPTAASGPCPAAEAYVALDATRIGALVARTSAPPGQRGTTCPGLVAVVGGATHQGAALHDRIARVAMEDGAIVGLAADAEHRPTRVVRWREGAAAIDERTYEAEGAPRLVRDLAIELGDPRAPRTSAVIRRLDGTIVATIELGPRGRATPTAQGSDGRMWAIQLLPRGRARASVIACR